MFKWVPFCKMVAGSGNGKHEGIPKENKGQSPIESLLTHTNTYNYIISVQSHQ